MKPLMLILLVVLGAVLVFKLTREKPAQGTQWASDEGAPTQVGPQNNQLPLSQRPLLGEEPAVPPEFDVQVEVPQDVGGNRIYLNITEQHGYYAETFQIELRRKDVDYRLELFYDKFLRANGTLRLQENVVPAELPNFGGEMGTGDDWEARVTNYGRARVEDPDPLPQVVELP